MFRVAVLALTVVTVGIAVPASPAGSPRTVVHRFRPFSGGKIAPGVHAVQTRHGYCWTTSGVESRRYAWRCFRGDFIHDPCFSAGKHSRFVLCPVEPWSGDVLRLRLTRALPPWRHSSYDARLPVGLWTTTGKHCTHSSGATSEIEGKPVTYACAGGGVLAGFAHRSTRTWTISYGTSFKAHRLARVGITDAWW